MSRIWGYSLLCGLCMATTALTALPVRAQESQLAPAVETQKQAAIGLDQAIAMALQNAPEIARGKALVKAADGARRQSTAWINPELNVEAENVAGTGAYKGFDGAETTASVGHTFEVGGKRSARRAIAEREQDLALLDERSASLDVVRQVKIAYVRAAAAQESIDLAQSENDLAQDILSGVTKRVDAAAEPRHQKNKARIALASSELALKKAARERDAALNILGQLTGGVVFSVQPEAFYTVSMPVDDALENGMAATRENLEVERSKAALRLEQADAVPDPTVSVGVRNFRQDDESALVIGVSMPLPVLNLNRGGIDKAREESVAREAERQKTLRDAKAELLEKHQQTINAYQEVETIRETILPEAEAALKEARRGYNAGAFAYLDVLDAQRTLAEAKTSYIGALSNYHISQAETEFLSAPVTNIQIEEISK